VGMVKMTVKLWGWGKLMVITAIDTVVTTR